MWLCEPSLIRKFWGVASKNKDWDWDWVLNLKICMRPYIDILKLSSKGQIRFFWHRLFHTIPDISNGVYIWNILYQIFPDNQGCHCCPYLSMPWRHAWSRRGGQGWGGGQPLNGAPSYSLLRPLKLSEYGTQLGASLMYSIWLVHFHKQVVNLATRLSKTYLSIHKLFFLFCFFVFNVKYYLFLLRLEAVFLNLYLDEHFRVQRLLIKYWSKNPKQHKI